MHCEYVVAVSFGSRSNGPLAGRGLAGASGEEEVADRLEPRSCFHRGAVLRADFGDTLEFRP
jgi:hypothetical protein